MLKTIRALTSLLALFLVMVVGPSPLKAQTFDDVRPTAWYFDYVERLASHGIVDSADAFRPNKPLTRAELVKMVIEATDGLANFIVPNSPTFADVQPGTWYYESIEAASELGLIRGYSNLDGTSATFFGPHDYIDRAAATKVVVSAFRIPMQLDQATVFNDVEETAWFHTYVTTAYTESIVSGYLDGSFGPSDPITRAQAAKLIALAMEQGEGLRGSAPEVGRSSSESTLKVGLSELQPPSLVIPLGSAAALLSIDFTASTEGIYIQEFFLTRAGVGNAADWAAIYAYDGDLKITSEYSVNRDTGKVRIPLNLLVEAGQTKTITVWGDTGIFATPSGQHTFYLASAADIESGAKQVEGNFKERGSFFTIGSEYANVVSITPGTTPTRPERDQQSEIASFKLQAGNSSDVAIDVITLTQGGTLDPSKLTSCILFRSDQAVSSAEGFYGDKLVFVFDEPTIIPDGQTRNFYVKCYIDGGRTSDSIQLYLEEIYDLIATDLDFGAPAGPLNGYTRTLAPAINLRGVRLIIQ